MPSSSRSNSFASSAGWFREDEDEDDPEAECPVEPDSPLSGRGNSESGIFLPRQAGRNRNSISEATGLLTACQQELSLYDTDSDGERLPLRRKVVAAVKARVIQGATAVRQNMSVDIAIVCVISLNIVVLGVQAALVQREDLKPIFKAIELIFTLVYVAEIAYRMNKHGAFEFFLGKDFGWNWFDAAVTGVGLIDVILAITQDYNSKGTSVARIFRTMQRLVRLFRTIKVVGHVGYVFYAAGKAALKLGTIVLTIIVVTSIVLTNLLWDSHDPHVAASFANLGDTMWEMFLLMTLDNWSARAAIVLQEWPSMWPFYVFYVFFASIALMALVPALFIELNAEDRKKEHVLEAKLETLRRKRRVEGMLQLVFNELDLDQKGLISIAEMQDELLDGSILHKLVANGYAPNRGDVQDIKLGLFELSQKQWDEVGDVRTEMDVADFVKSVMEARNEVDNVALWRCSKSAHMHLDELFRFVRTEFRQLRHLFDGEFAILKRSVADINRDLATMKTGSDDLSQKLGCVREFLDARYESSATDATSQKDDWIKRALTSSTVNVLGSQQELMGDLVGLKWNEDPLVTPMPSGLTFPCRQVSPAADPLAWMTAASLQGVAVAADDDAPAGRTPSVRFCDNPSPESDIDDGPGLQRSLSPFALPVACEVDSDSSAEQSEEKDDVSDDLEDCVKCGKLWKLNNNGVAENRADWAERFFTLNVDGTLEYETLPAGGRSVTMFSGESVECVQVSEGGSSAREHCWQMQLVDEDDSDEEWDATLLAADTSEDMSSWLEAFKSFAPAKAKEEDKPQTIEPELTEEKVAPPESPKTSSTERWSKVQGKISLMKKVTKSTKGASRYTIMEQQMHPR